jgi:hypothetical protein
MPPTALCQIRGSEPRLNSMTMTPLGVVQERNKYRLVMSTRISDPWWSPPKRPFFLFFTWRLDAAWDCRTGMVHTPQEQRHVHSQHRQCVTPRQHYQGFLVSRKVVHLLTMEGWYQRTPTCPEGPVVWRYVSVQELQHKYSGTLLLQ